MSNRGWDERSYRDDSGRYVTKTQYHVAREDDRMSAFQEDRHSNRGVETRIVRREISPAPRVERDIRIERYERAPEPPRSAYRVVDRDVRVRPRADDYQLDRYIRTTEYYPPRGQPRDEDDYQVVRRSDYEDQQLARREPQGREEDYYYERRVREVDGRSRSRSRHSSKSSERRKRRSRSKHYSSDDDMVYVKREVTEGRSDDPHHRRHLAEGALAGVGVAELLRHHRVKKGGEEGSTKGRVGRDVGAAAAGAIGAEVISRARSAYRSRSRAGKSRAGSDDDREYRRRRRRSGSRERSRSQSTSRVKTLAGIGIGVAALAAAAGYAKHRHDQNKLPEDQRRSRSRARRASTGGTEVESNKNRNIAGAGLAGAAVAGIIEKVRSKSRGRDGRSRSNNRLKTGVPIVAAGLGSAAIAGILENRKEKKNEEAREAEAAEAKQRRQSRSRSRRRSNSIYDGPPMASHSTPGLIEYGEAPVSAYPNNPQDYYRSQPHYDYAVPAVGGAAAGYGASRAAETYSPRDHSPSRDRYRRDSSASSDDGGRRSRRHRRRKSGAAGSRERSGSRARELATAGLAAGAAALGMNEFNKRRQKKKDAEADARDRAQAEQNAAYDPNSPAYSQFSPLSPGHGIEQGYAPEQYYPHTNQFAPPPGGYQHSPVNEAYNQADYAHPHPSTNPNEYYQPHPGYSPTQHHQAYSPPPPPVGANYAPAGAARGDENVSPGARPDLRSAEEGIRGREETPRPSDRQKHRSKSVQFAGGEESPDGQLSPDDRRHRRQRRQRQYSPEGYSSDSDVRDNRRRSKRGNTRAESSPDADARDNQRRSRRGERHESPDSDDYDDNRRRSRRRNGDRPPPRPASPNESDSTIDLPPRFDQDGRPRSQRNSQKNSAGGDPIAEKIEKMLNGEGTAGKLFKSITDNFLGGGGKDNRR